MKKSLISVAVMSLMASPLVIKSVQAQSNVTIYGTVDAGMRVQNHAGKDHLGNSKDSQLSTNSGGLSAPHLGFKGEENLGGGNKTFFKLETGFDMNTGDNNSSSDTSVHGKKSDNKSLFGRQAHLGISSQSLGQLTLGRQNTVGYDAIKDFDPTNNLNQKGLIHYLSGYTDLKNNHNRSDGTIKYQHQLNRVTFLASYQSGNQVGSVKHGSSTAIGMKYRDANWSVGGSFTEIDVAKSAETASKASQSLGSTKIINFGGEYRFNRWTFKTGVSHSKLPAIQRGSISQTSHQASPERDQFASDVFVSAWGMQYQLSSKVDLGIAHYTKLQHDHKSRHLVDKDKSFVLTGVYKLSKQTDIYGFLDQHRNSNGVANGNHQKTQYGVTAGLRHKF